MRHNPAMKTQYAIKKAKGIKNLAAIFKITTTAIYAWGESMPPLREFQFLAWLKKKGMK
jgi:hypothetical protein